MQEKKKIIAMTVFGIGVLLIGAAYVYSWRDVARQVSQIQVSPPASEDVQELQSQFQSIQESLEEVNQSPEESIGEDEEILDQEQDQLSSFERAMLEVE